jgi:4-amino-4-deoxy-L-arabinose transferase-like glycosyltransferase
LSEHPGGPSQRLGEARVALALALVATAFLFTGLSRYGVVNADEAIYHGVAERMLETGDWLRLDFRGEPRVYDAFLNAPLHYWARAGLIAAFGSNAFTMRALSALFGVLTVLATWALARRLAGGRAAVLAAAVQLTTFQFVYLHGARTGELDTLVSFLLVAAALALFRALDERLGFLPHHLAVAALCLTKAPLALVPVAAGVVVLVARPGSRRRLPAYLATGAALLPLALAWHATQLLLHGERAGEVLGAMLAQAGGSDRDVADLGLAGNARFYAGVLLHGAFPWSLVYPFALLRALRGDELAARLRSALAFAAALLLFFLLVAKHYAWYAMPALPFLSLAVGVWLGELASSGVRRSAAFGAGLALAALAWADVDLFGTNPFATRALGFPMELRWRSPAGLPAIVALPLAGAAWLLLCQALGRAGRHAATRRLGAAAVAALLVAAGLRCLAPFAHLDTRAPIERTRRSLERALREGRPIDYPVRLRRPVVQIARFHFGEDFEIVPEYTPEGTDLLLYPQGDPAVLDRSIGRAGLERRLGAAGGDP